MDKFDEKLFEMAKTETARVPFGFDAAVDAQLSKLTGAGSRRSPRRALRPLRAALACVLALALLTGTALAVTSLWGGMDDVSQDLTGTSAVQVYDGVEARIASAVSDGYVTVLHVEFRDTSGSRVQETYEEYNAADGKERDKLAKRFSTRCFSLVGQDVADELMELPSPSRGWTNSALTPRILGFDAETDVMTVEYRLCSAIPADIPRQAYIELYAGIAGTLGSAEPVIPDFDATAPRTEAAVYSVDLSGLVVAWRLTADLTALPQRSLSVDAVVNTPAFGDVDYSGAHISAAGVTMEYADPNHPFTFDTSFPDVTVTMSDGSTVTGQYAGSAQFAKTVRTDSWFLTSSIDPAEVVSISFGSTVIPIE